MNLALGRPAKQSRNNFGTTGPKAVDDDLSDTSVIHAHPDAQAW